MRLLYDLDQDSGAMPIRWCLDEAEQTLILERELTHLYVVIDLFYGHQSTGIWQEARARQRFVLPLKQYMQFVSFYRPGLVHICTALITPHSTQEKELTRMRDALFERGDHGEYLNRLFEFEDVSGDTPAEQIATVASNHGFNCKCEVLAFAHDRIDVPQELFAQPFTGWLKWWVELVPRELLRRRPHDQCDQRRWAIFAFTLQPFLYPVALFISLGLFLVVYVVTVMTAGYYGVWRGYRGIDWAEVGRGAATPSQVKSDVDREGWVSRYDATIEYEPRPFLQRLLQPAFITLAIGGWWTFVWIQAKVDATEPPLELVGTDWLSLLLGLLLAIVGFIGFIPSVRDAVKEAMHERWTAGRDERREQQRRHEREEVARQEAARLAESEQVRVLVADLACPVVPQAAAQDARQFLRPEAIPPQHRTLRLRFDAIKAKICRPLAR